MKWKKGQKTQLAIDASIHPNTLSSIITGKKGCTEAVAKRLEKASETMFGKNKSIKAAVWLMKRDHPLLPPFQERRERLESVRKAAMERRAKLREERDIREGKIPAPAKADGRRSVSARKKKKRTEMGEPLLKTEPLAPCKKKVKSALEKFREQKAKESAEKLDKKELGFLMGEPAKADASERDYEMPEQEDVAVGLDLADVKVEEPKASDSKPEPEPTPEAHEEETTPSFKDAVKSLSKPKPTPTSSARSSKPRPNFRRRSDYRRPPEHEEYAKIEEERAAQTAAAKLTPPPPVAKPVAPTPPPPPPAPMPVFTPELEEETRLIDAPMAKVISKPNAADSEYIDLDAELAPLSYIPEPVVFRV